MIHYASHEWVSEWVRFCVLLDTFQVISETVLQAITCTGQEIYDIIWYIIWYDIMWHYMIYDILCQPRMSEWVRFYIVLDTLQIISETVLQAISCIGTVNKINSKNHRRNEKHCLTMPTTLSCNDTVTFLIEARKPRWSSVTISCGHPSLTTTLAFDSRK